MNNEFKWDDKSIEEMLVKAFSERLFVGSYKTPKTIIEEFKASHTTEEKRDWEIIEVRHKNHTGRDWVLTDREGINNVAGNNFGHNWYIHSVKRLSDNEVFSLGDKIDMDECGAKPIDAFYVGGKGKEAGHTESDIWISTNQKKQHGVLLNYASKPLQRTPLFKDFHGNDVFEGDRVWWIVIHNNNLWTINNEVMKSDTSFSHNRVFTSDFAAKEYRLMNKPSLSVSDILSMDMNMDLTGRVLIWKDKLIEKAKNKS